MINEDQEYYLAGAKHVWWKHGNDTTRTLIAIGTLLAIWPVCWGIAHVVAALVHLLPQPTVHKTNFVYHAPKGIETYKQYVAQHPMTGIGLPP